MYPEQTLINIQFDSMEITKQNFLSKISLHLLIKVHFYGFIDKIVKKVFFYLECMDL